jgi:hypothetical protein
MNTYEALANLAKFVKKHITNPEKHPEYEQAKNVIDFEKGFFPVTTVHRDDLENEGFDTSNVDDHTMKELAEKMGEAYTSSGYWIDLNILAENLDIPKKTETESSN